MGSRGADDGAGVAVEERRLEQDEVAELQEADYSLVRQERDGGADIGFGELLLRQSLLQTLSQLGEAQQTDVAVIAQRDDGVL
jgi:hypothetical protein